jgi:hypothetical protein
MSDENTPGFVSNPEVGTKTVDQQTFTTVAPVGGLVGTDAGLPAAGSNGGGVLRAGGITLDVGADVTGQLDEAIPAMGNVLMAIGNGVASSQQALDQGVVDTVKTLNGTDITVVTQVIEHLNDDGIPDAGKTELITQDLSVLNFFMPTFHEWKNVSVSMDMIVGSFHQEQGLQFSQRQHTDVQGGVGGFWGFLGWYATDESTTQTNINASSSQDVIWKHGKVRVDALLGPRTTGKFPVPASVSVGPQIFITQGAAVEQKTGDVVTGRSVDLQIEVRKADGSVNPGKNIALNSAGLLPSFPAGNTTDANGKVSVTLTRSITPGFGGFRNFLVTASMNQVQRSTTITL